MNGLKIYLNIFSKDGTSKEGKQETIKVTIADWK
jgi:hypothetical protein